MADKRNLTHSKANSGELDVLTILITGTHLEGEELRGRRYRLLGHKLSNSLHTAGGIMRMCELVCTCVLECV